MLTYAKSNRAGLARKAAAVALSAALAASSQMVIPPLRAR